MSSRNMWSLLRRELNNYYCPITSIISMMEVMGTPEVFVRPCPNGYDCKCCLAKPYFDKHLKRGRFLR